MHIAFLTVLNEQLFVQPAVKPGCTAGFTTVLNEQPLFVNVCMHDTTGCQTDLTTGLTTGCIVYTHAPILRVLAAPLWTDKSVSHVKAVIHSLNPVGTTHRVFHSTPLFVFFRYKIPFFVTN